MCHPPVSNCVPEACQKKLEPMAETRINANIIIIMGVICMYFDRVYLMTNL